MLLRGVIAELSHTVIGLPWALVLPVSADAEFSSLAWYPVWRGGLRSIGTIGRKVSPSCFPANEQLFRTFCFNATP